MGVLGDMIEYCQTRECMKPFFEEQNIKEDEQERYKH